MKWSEQTKLRYAFDLTSGGTENPKLTIVADSRCREVALHEKNGHQPKMDGCKACEMAYMQAKAARKGAKVRGNLVTANGDLLDFSTPDNNGDRYGFDVIMLQKSAGRNARYMGHDFSILI